MKKGVKEKNKIFSPRNLLIGFVGIIISLLIFNYFYPVLPFNKTDFDEDSEVGELYSEGIFDDLGCLLKLCKQLGRLCEGSSNSYDSPPCPCSGPHPGVCFYCDENTKLWAPKRDGTICGYSGGPETKYCLNGDCQTCLNPRCGQCQYCDFDSGERKCNIDVGAFCRDWLIPGSCGVDGECNTIF